MQCHRRCIYVLSNRRGLSDVVANLIIDVIVIGLIVIFYLVYATRYFDIHTIIIENGVERHTLNLGQVLLSYDKLVYIDSTIQSVSFVCCSKCFCDIRPGDMWDRGYCTSDCTSETFGKLCSSDQPSASPIDCEPQTATWDRGDVCPAGRPTEQNVRYCESTAADDEDACKKKCEAEGYTYLSYDIFGRVCSCKPASTIYVEDDTSYMRIYRGVFVKEKIEEQFMEGSDLTREIGYPNAAIALYVKDFVTGDEWNLAYSGPSDISTNRLVSGVNCLVSKIKLDITILFRIPPTPWETFDFVSCVSSDMSSYGSAVRSFPVAIKDGNSVHAGVIKVAIYELW